MFFCDFVLLLYFGSFGLCYGLYPTIGRLGIVVGASSIFVGYRFRSRISAVVGVFRSSCVLLLLPHCIFQVWALFWFSGNENSPLCMFRRMFASSDHVLFPHVVFSSEIVCACSGVVGCFWLILIYAPCLH